MSSTSTKNTRAPSEHKAPHRMSNTKNSTEKQAPSVPARIKFVADKSLAESQGEAWRKWNVTPKIAFLENPNLDPEKDIGKRIAYCRAQMDNLSVEALARYTKRFDKVGISRTTLVRYESGENIPGGRELRILADTLSVPVRWLLLADFGSDGLALTDEDARFIEVARRWVKSMSGQELPEFVADARETQRKAEIAQRQRWIDEDRRPQEKD